MLTASKCNAIRLHVHRTRDFGVSGDGGPKWSSKWSSPPLVSSGFMYASNSLVLHLTSVRRFFLGRLVCVCRRATTACRSQTTASRRLWSRSPSPPQCTPSPPPRMHVVMHVTTCTCTCACACVHVHVRMRMRMRSIARTSSYVAFTAAVHDGITIVYTRRATRRREDRGSRDVL